MIKRFGMWIAWTTVATRADADRLAADAVVRNLAACVQIDGPITSHYRWQGQVERSEEFRLCFKCLPSHLESLTQRILETHPYETPEWLVVHADKVGEKYLSWAEANSSTRPL
jgi:periplasmic divalent cation tolerance protein